MVNVRETLDIPVEEGRESTRSTSSSVSSRAIRRFRLWPSPGSTPGDRSGAWCGPIGACRTRRSPACWKVSRSDSVPRHQGHRGTAAACPREYATDGRSLPRWDTAAAAVARVIRRQRNTPLSPSNGRGRKSAASRPQSAADPTRRAFMCSSQPSFASTSRESRHRSAAADDGRFSAPPGWAVASARPRPAAVRDFLTTADLAEVRRIDASCG